jgi:Na+-transporting NADH:ubiquinone oxidoreductase subunit C
MQKRDSLGYTLAVAVILCVVCSLAVSTAAVVLRPRQEANERLDQQKNILDASGLAIGEYGKIASQLDSEQIQELYGWISEKLVDLESGEYTEEIPMDQYNMIELASNSQTSVSIDVKSNIDPGEPSRPKIMKVYFVKRPGSDDVQTVVLPIYGKGLWGTLYGYLAVKRDLHTIQGITFYKHKETPGLGGEVDNPSWKAQWEGQQLFDEEGQPASLVYKGPAPPSNPYAVDGLSGATITSRGVTKLVRYWVSDNAYGPFLEKLAVELGVQPSSNKTAGKE